MYIIHISIVTILFEAWRTLNLICAAQIAVCSYHFLLYLHYFCSYHLQAKSLKLNINTIFIDPSILNVPGNQ